MSLNDVLTKLASEEAFPSAVGLCELSGLNAEETKAFKAVWESASVERRRKVTARLVELAEENIELDFNAIFRHALRDDDEDVRTTAIAGLWECEERSLIGPLVQLVNDDPSDRVRCAAVQGLGRFALLAEMGKLLERDCRRIEDALLAVLDSLSETIEVRRRAIEAIAPMSLLRVPQIVQEAYDSQDPKVQASALFAMGSTCDPRWLPTLIGELENENPELRYEAAAALGGLGEEEAVAGLIEALDDSDEQVQESVIYALGAIGGGPAKKALVQASEAGEPRVAEMALAALRMIEFEDAPLSLDRQP
ncbi:MAG: HEAT repeat domain-containing protein [Dehalococcoidia bacterium]